MYNTIVIPVDIAHQERFEKMIDVTRKLANENARVILTNIVEEIPKYIATELPNDLITKSERVAKSKLTELAKLSNFDAQIDVRSGHPSKSILEVAEENDADCIIVASHHPILVDYLLGSTAARVVRHAQCSVHVLR
ncbi:MAG: universal stress protein [bacterium]|nr:universal stress protein [bacterium]